MDIWDIKREALIPAWQERIRECRSSGLTVRAWCAMNNISRQTYYNWEKMCLSKVEQNPKRSEETRGQDNALIKFNPELLPSSTEPISSISISSAELVIRCGCVSMDISPQMPVSRIAELVFALDSHV